MTNPIESEWSELGTFEQLFPIEFTGVTSNIRIDEAQINRQKLLSLILGHSDEVTIILPGQTELTVSELQLAGDTLKFR